jgi:hypothetical protein
LELRRSQVVSAQVVLGPVILIVSQSPYACVLFLQTAGAAWQEVDEADGEAATDAGDRVRHMPLRPDRHRAAGSLWVAQVP